VTALFGPPPSWLFAVDCFMIIVVLCAICWHNGSRDDKREDFSDGKQPTKKKEK
jgi:hypothetical protein